MTKISREFLISLKLHPLPAYRIAQAAGLNPAVLSKLIRGIEPVKPDDPRIVEVGRVLGLTSSECFRSDRDAA